ncbi:MAG TPA: hypothetical protein VH186_31880 [Chloroflexia bacterium]|nr:hypothetical protein [Chloroflexia bacterium]
MTAFRPAFEFVVEVVIQATVGLFAANRAVIITPTLDYRIEVFD